MGVYPYLLLLGVYHNGIGAVGDKPAVFHPAGQGEAQVHTDMVIQRPVISGHIRTERAVPVCHLA